MGTILVTSLSSISDITPEVQNSALRKIDNLDKQLQHHFQTKFLVQPALTRLLVSFQANKTRPIYRWYKYKEAFSASLVELLLEKYRLNQGKILDPFAGSGTALFAVSDLGLDADGIELLPIGQMRLMV
jgi:DNA modification methylase